MSGKPTLREVLAGYNQFNVWEVEERKKTLPQLAVEESLSEYFELCELPPRWLPTQHRYFLNKTKLAG
ncbi:hypothetical protein ACFLXQ_00360 [Chloroflexota bacterium]